MKCEAQNQPNAPLDFLGGTVENTKYRLDRPFVNNPGS